MVLNDDNTVKVWIKGTRCCAHPGAQHKVAVLRMCAHPSNLAAHPAILRLPDPASSHCRGTRDGRINNSITYKTKSRGISVRPHLEYTMQASSCIAIIYYDFVRGRP